MPYSEKDLIAYAGRDFLQPRKMLAASISFSDYDTPEELKVALEAFCATPGVTEFAPHEYSDESTYLIGFMAFRLETDAEVVARVMGYEKELDQRAARKAKNFKPKETERQTYERLKKKFEVA